ncbi:MAG: PLDc N-terminal domain-containing protein [Litorimonas sp.]
MFEGILGLLHLIVWIWAAINIWQSAASTLAKVLWTLFVLIAPVVGLIVWFFIGPKSSSRLA